MNIGDGDLSLPTTVIRVAGGSSIDADGAEQQRAIGVITCNDLHPPLLNQTSSRSLQYVYAR